MSLLEPDGSPSVARFSPGLISTGQDVAAITSDAGSVPADFDRMEISGLAKGIDGNGYRYTHGPIFPPEDVSTEGGRFASGVPNAFERAPSTELIANYRDGIAIGPRVGSQVHPATLGHAIDRFLATRRLFESGALHEEVSKLGVSPAWLDRLHAEPASVVIFEQLAPLALNFGALGQAGRPEALHQAFRFLESAAAQLFDRGVERISQGYLGSQHHVVTFHGITESFHVTLPGKENSEERKWFFTTGERNRFDAAGYLDLVLSDARLAEMREMIVGLADPKASNGTLRGLAAKSLLQDWDKATSLSRETSTNGGKVSFCDFVSHLNSLLAHRYGVSPGHFETRFHDTVDGIATTGVDNWPKFISALLKSGALHPTDTVLRLRVTNGKGFPRYLSLHLQDPGADFVSQGDVTLSDKDSKQPQHFSIRDLVDQSRASLGRGEGITLVPAAPICYWGNFAVGNVLGFLDGSVNARLHRVAQAMLSPEMTQAPRALTVAPYTSLVNKVPADPHRPYHGIDEVGTILDFYEYTLMHQSPLS